MSDSVYADEGDPFLPGGSTVPYAPKVSVARRRQHWQRTGGRCWYCGKTFSRRSAMQLDHIQARSRGGSNDDQNLVPCCKDCNRRKKSNSLERFREQEWRRRYHFTREQEAYLQSLGVELPAPDVRPQHVFAFEHEGWT